MANVNYWSASWIAGEYGYLDDLYPGESHSWVMWGFNLGTVIDVAAYAVVGDPTAGERILQIEDARIEADPSGYRFYFSVRNAGGSSIPGYSLNYSQISN